jgi:hypothetical protein
VSKNLNFPNNGDRFSFFVEEKKTEVGKSYKQLVIEILLCCSEIVFKNYRRNSLSTLVGNLIFPTQKRLIFISIEITMSARPRSSSSTTNRSSSRNSYSKPASRPTSRSQHPDGGNFQQPSEKRQIVGQYMLGKTIGEGTFGKVRLAAHMPTGEKVSCLLIELKVTFADFFCKSLFSFFFFFHVPPTQNNNYFLLYCTDRWQ